MQGLVLVATLFSGIFQLSIGKLLPSTARSVYNLQIVNIDNLRLELIGVTVDYSHCVQFCRVVREEEGSQFVAKFSRRSAKCSCYSVQTLLLDVTNFLPKEIQFVFGYSGEFRFSHFIL